MQREADRLRIRPCIPRSWSGFKVTYCYGETIYEISVQRDAAADTLLSVALDGVALPNSLVPLTNDGASHSISVTLPAV